jgi:hypothetical protein
VQAYKLTPMGKQLTLVLLGTLICEAHGPRVLYLEEA